MPVFDQNVTASLAISASKSVLRFNTEENIDYLKTMNQFDQIGTWEYMVRSRQAIWSPEVFQIHGLPYQSGPVDLKRALSFYLDSDVKSLETLIEQAIRVKSGFRSKFRLRRTDGKVRVVESGSAPVIDTMGNVVKLVGYFRDVTAIVSEENIRNSHQDLLMRIILSVPIAVAMLDKNLRYIAHSEAWKAVFDIPRDRVLIGLKLSDNLAEIASVLDPVFNLVLNGQPAGKNNQSLNFGESTTLTCDWVMQPWTDHVGAVGGVVMMLNAKTKHTASNGPNVIHFTKK